MSHFKVSYQEFIQCSFSPLVAVMCSPLVDQTCKKNNLSFTELVQPFCKLNTEATFRDPSGATVIMKNFRINISDITSRPPQPTMARKFLNESVSSHVNERTTHLEIGGASLDVPVSVPWFDAWRDTFLQVQFPSDHEFTKHYLACLLVVSSKEPSPLDSLTQMSSQLQQMQTISPAKLPKWFSPPVLRYHVLLHDLSEGNTPLAESLFETMKTTYGVNNVFFLCINSRSAPSDSQLPDPWSQFLNRHVPSQELNEMDPEAIRNHVDGPGTVETAQEAGEITSPTSPTATPVILHPLSPVSDQLTTSGDKSLLDGVTSNSWPLTTGLAVTHGVYLTAEDLDRLRELVSCFCLKSLIPHVEQQIQQLTEQISNKKGMSRSLLSATKRWFGSNKPGIPNTPTPTVTYNNDSTELQLRRLGDLCFMFGAYSLAFTAYHAAKRDFNADAAWLYYAGALEMAALSLFMQPADSTKKAQEYAEESILTYLNSCRMPQFATRATLFSAECLCGRGLWGEAAKQLIRMTAEDSDLRSALLLEQAAYCFLSSPRPPMPRKYAFHLVLAGHRFSKAGQKKHSLRCYRQAYQVYENKKWSLAEDHIHHTMGRQAMTLKKVTEAAESFALLLPRASRQSPAQQTLFLREYISSQQQLNSETGELPILPLPVVDNDSIQVLLGQPPPPPPPQTADSSLSFATGVSFDLQPEDSKRWIQMEEQLVMAAAGASQPMVFKPTVELLDNTTNNLNSPNSYVGETISVSVSLTNPLHIAVSLLNVRLLWSFIPGGGGLCQANSLDTSDSDCSAACTHVIDRLMLQPDCSSKVILRLTPLQVGELRVTGIGCVLEGEGNSVAGRQLLRPRGRKLRSKLPDNSNSTSAQYSPDNRLNFNIHQSAPTLRVSFQGLQKDMFCGELTQAKVQLENCGSLEVNRLLLATTSPGVVSMGRRGGKAIMEVPLTSPLAPGQSISVPMRVRAHDTRGSFTVHLLFYYETVTNQTKPLYRLVQHSWHILVHDSLQVSVTATRSAVSQADGDSDGDQETLSLRLQVQNTNQVHDSVKCVSCVECAALHSAQWQLTDRGFHPAAITLGPQELAHLLLKVRRRAVPAEPVVSHLPLVQGSSLLPCADFLPCVHQTDAVTDDHNTIESVTALHATFVLMWKATIEMRGGDARVAVGQHHVRLSSLGVVSWWPPLPSPSPTPTSPSALRIFGTDPQPPAHSALAARQRLVSYTLTSAHGKQHQFGDSSVCVVPVELFLRNCSDCDVKVRVEASGIASSLQAREGLHSLHSFHWVGVTRQVFPLGPHRSRRVRLAAAVGAPGTFDLSSHLTIHARPSTELEYVTQAASAEAILVVT